MSLFQQNLAVCSNCGGTKFHVTSYHEITSTGLKEIPHASEARCVTCHQIYFVKDLMAVLQREENDRPLDYYGGAPEKTTP